VTGHYHPIQGDSTQPSPLQGLPRVAVGVFRRRIANSAEQDVAAGEPRARPAEEDFDATAAANEIGPSVAIDVAGSEDPVARARPQQRDAAPAEPVEPQRRGQAAAEDQVAVRLVACVPLHVAHQEVGSLVAVHVSRPLDLGRAWEAGGERCA